MSATNYEEALNILSTTESTSLTSVSTDYTTFTVINRTINIPLNTIVTVQGDTNSRIIKFSFSRYYDGVDLSQKTIRVCYVNSINMKGYTNISQFTTDETTLSFLWTIPSEVSVYSGNVKIKVDFYTVNSYSTIYRWQTRETTFAVLPTFSVGSNATGSDYTYDIAFYNNNDNSTVYSEMYSLDAPITLVDRDLIFPITIKTDLVQQDTRSRIVPFQTPRFIDGIDISTKTICIKFINEYGEGDRSRICNLTIDDTTLSFNWLMTDHVASKDGKVSFALEVIGYNELGEFYILQSKAAQFDVIENLKVDGTPENPVPSWYQTFQLEATQTLKDLDFSLTQDYLRNTTQTTILNTDDTIQKIQHVDLNNVIIREDVYTYNGDIVTEVRTMNTGESVTFTYNLSTYETTIS